MRASRGMGDIAPSKMPTKPKVIIRKDDPNKVYQYAKGGKVMAEKWIQGAIKHPGSLRKALKAKAGEPIPAKKLAAAAKKPGKIGQKARLAETLKKLKKK
jgi:hypothetical protein